MTAEIEMGGSSADRSPAQHHARSTLLLLSTLLGATALLAACITATSTTTTTTTAPPTTTTTTEPPLGPDRSVTIEFAPDSIARSAGFGELSFIDSGAEVIESVDLAADGVEPMLGEGWLDVRSAGSDGQLRWAGSDAPAMLEVILPLGTEGLILTGRAAGAARVTITVEGEDSVSSTIGATLRGIYVPVGAPAPEASPDAEPVWTAGRVFPAFPEFDHVYVLRFEVPAEVYRSQDSDWRVDDVPEAMHALTLVGMQGVINRTGPRVYIDWLGADWGFPPEYRGYWAERVAEANDTTYLHLDPESAIRFLWRRFSPRFEGSVTYDPAVPHTINVATMIAGLENRVMMAAEQSEMGGIPDFGVDRDLRELVAEQGWDDSTESRHAIHRWVYENLWPDLEHRIIGVMNPGPPTIERQRENGFEYALGLAARDYFVALRLPTLYFNPSEPPDSELFAQFLEDAPSPIPLTGIFDEFEPGTVELASDHGDFVAGMTWPGVTLVNGNMTVLGEQGQGEVYEAELDTDRILATLGTAPVATVYSKGGDAISGLLDRDDPFFAWHEVQGSRFGYTVNPTLFSLAPLAWNSDLAIRSETSLISGISGVGYARPHRMSDEQLAAYLAATREYFEATGLRVAEIDIQEGPVVERTARAYYEALSDAGLLGLYQTTVGASNLSFEYLGAPTPVIGNELFLLPDTAGAVAEQLLLAEGGAATTDIAARHSQGLEIEDPTAVGGSAIVLNRETLGGCCLGASVPVAVRAAGTYAATYRLRVPDTSSTLPIVQLFLVNQQTGQTYGSRFLSPSDFAAADEWEEFTTTFTAQGPLSDLEVWVDYYGGEPNNADVDVVIDTIAFGPEGGDAEMPVFASVFIDDHPNLTSELPAQFQTEFEGGGGILLTPDEFAAALNPEFMIELAIPMLGEDHESVTRARELLAQGRYFEALLTIRAGLTSHLNP